MNYYSVLNVEYGVGKEELKKAYRKMVKIYHPDRCTLPDANRKFAQVQQAYEYLLRNAEKESVRAKQEASAPKQKYSQWSAEFYSKSTKQESAANETKQNTYHFTEEKLEDLKQELNASFGKLPLLIRAIVYLLLISIGSLLLLKYGLFISIVFVSTCIVFELFRAMFKNNAQYNFAKK
jgi:curved DNA-binding protein CbpA